PANRTMSVRQKSILSQRLACSSQPTRYRHTAKLMVFKLVGAASKTWRRLKGTNQLPKVIPG
ncbi:hypothetical protein D6B98_39510, partial [Bradyrhizobium sp. LVM 105]